MNDIESRIARIMNDNVNAQLQGVGRRPPPLDTRRLGGIMPGRVRWLLPLAAAVAVAAAAVGAVLLADINKSPHRGPSPAVLGTSAISTESAPSTAPATSSRATDRHSTTPTAARSSVLLGGARIVLPAGWVARDLGLNMDSKYAHIWCLVPATTVLGKDSSGCPITFGVIDPIANPVDVDLPGGWLSNPHYCFQGANRKTSEQAGDRPFGQRTSDWRHWSITCAGHDFELEQYVVATNPGFNLFSAKADATVRAAMAEIALNAVLPLESSPLRLMDRGYLRSVSINGSTARVVIDRAIPLDPKGVINNSAATYVYDVPMTMYRATNAGFDTLVSIYTNGRTVREFDRF